MNFKEFKAAGHWPTLMSAFLYFDVSFMVWVMLGLLSLYITKELGLPVEEKFTIVAIPIGLLMAKQRWRTTWGALSSAKV